MNIFRLLIFCFVLVATNKIDAMKQLSVSSAKKIEKIDTQACDMHAVTLHNAVWSGCLSCIKLALNNKNNLHKIDKEKRTPLHYAARYNKTSDIAEILIFKGANINALDQDKRTPLYIAVKHNTLKFVEFLLDQRALINAQDCWGYTVLHLAVFDNSLEKVTLLLKKGANPNLKDQDGKKPSDQAKEEEIKKLLISYEINN